MLGYDTILLFTIFAATYISAASRPSLHRQDAIPPTSYLASLNPNNYFSRGQPTFRATSRASRPSRLSSLSEDDFFLIPSLSSEKTPATNQLVSYTPPIPPRFNRVTFDDKRSDLQSVEFFSRFIQRDYHAASHGDVGFSEILGCHVYVKDLLGPTTQPKSVLCIIQPDRLGWNVNTVVVLGIVKVLRREPRSIPVKVFQYGNVFTRHGGMSRMEWREVDIDKEEEWNREYHGMWKLVVGECDANEFGERCMRVIFEPQDR